MMPSLARDLVASLRSPSFWAYSTWLEVIAKYRRSRLGLFWAMVPAAAYIWGMGSFFASMMNVPLAKMIPHAALGTLVFRFFSSVISDANAVFSAHQSFVLDNRIRLTDLILRTLAKAFFYAAVAMPVVVAAMFMSDHFVPQGVLVAMLVAVVVVVNALWISVLMGLVGARFPDLQEMTGSVLMFAYILTPIIWFKSNMPEGTLRGDVMRFNPFFHFVELFRAPILGEAIEPSSIVYVAVMTVLGTVTAALAYRYYARQVPIWL